jgi:hypothetical protein
MCVGERLNVSRFKMKLSSKAGRRIVCSVRCLVKRVPFA